MRVKREERKRENAAYHHFRTLRSQAVTFQNHSTITTQCAPAMMTLHTPKPLSSKLHTPKPLSSKLHTPKPLSSKLKSPKTKLLEIKPGG